MERCKHRRTHADVMSWPRWPQENPHHAYTGKITRAAHGHLADRRHSYALRERTLRRTGSDCSSHKAAASADGSGPIRRLDEKRTRPGIQHPSSWIPAFVGMTAPTLFRAGLPRT